MTDKQLRNLLAVAKVIAVVGLSDDPDRPSFQVAAYLKSQGFTIIPINPRYVTILGETCYPDLPDAQKAIAPQVIDIVDIFRRSELVPPHVDEALTLKPKLIWMQEGVEHQAAAAKAIQAGIPVVMNTCLKKTHQRLFGKV